MFESSAVALCAKPNNAFRSLQARGLSLNPGGSGRGRGNQDSAKIIDIRTGRASDDQILQPCKKAIGIIIGEAGPRIQPPVRRAGQTVRKQNGPRVVFDAINAVGVAGQRGNSLCPIQFQRKGQQKFGIAPPAPCPTDSNGCFPPPTAGHRAQGRVGCTD